MRPLYLSLAIFGLYHTPKHSQVEPAKDTGDQNTNPPRILPKAIRFYCIFICCLMSLSVIRYLPSFWVGVDFIPDLTAHRIVNVIWTIQNAVNSLVLFVFFEQKNRFERHEKQYINVTTDSISKRLKTNPRTEHVKTYNTGYYSWLDGSSIQHRFYHFSIFFRLFSEACVCHVQPSLLSFIGC